MKNTIQNILAAEAEAIRNIPVGEGYGRSVELIYRHVHELNGKVVTSGMGKAGQIALNIATTLSSTGTPAVFINAAEAQHGDLGVIARNDVLLLISNSGKTREIVELRTLIHRLYKDIPVILITGNPNGPLVEQANVSLFTGGPEEVCPLGLTPTTSTTAMTVIGDVLVVGMINKTGFTKQEYAKRHHGGYLGAKSKTNNE